MFSGNVELTNANLNHNLAARYGGAIYTLESLTSSVISIYSNEFQNNMAVKGGAIYSQSTSYMQIYSLEATFDTLIFSGNKALTGACLYYSALNSFKNTLHINYANFTNNEIVEKIEDLNIPQEYNTDIEYLKTEGNVLLGYSLEDPCYPGGGGAICLKTHDTAITSAIDIELKSILFERNKAMVGGACLFVTENEILSNLENRKFEIENCTFIDNEAESAGGGLFIFNPANLIDSFTDNDLTMLMQNTTSMTFDGNKVNNGYGSDVASDLSYLNITSDLSLLDNVASSEEFNVILQLHDVYGSHITSAIEDSGIINNCR